MVENRRNYREYNRGPRKSIEIPAAQVTIPSYPELRETLSNQSMLVLFAPTIGTVLFGIMAYVMSRNLISLMIAPVGLVYPLIMIFVRKSQEKEYAAKLQKHNAVYTNVLNQKKAELAELEDKQIKALNDLNPNLETLKDWTVRADARTWERKPGDGYNDFLALRFGEGELPTRTKIEAPKLEHPDLEENSQVVEAHVISQRYSKPLRGVPITLSLTDLTSLALVGEMDRAEDLARALLASMAVLHYPAEVELFSIVAPGHLPEWGWLRWLPHSRMIGLESGIRHMASTSEEIRELSDKLMEVLDARETAGGKTQPVFPYIILFIQDISLLQDGEVLQRIINNGAALRACVMLISQEMNRAPENCRGVLQVGTLEATLSVQGTGHKITVKPEFGSVHACEVIARSLAKLPLRGGSGLPRSVRLSEVFEMENVSGFDLKGNWELASRQPPSLLTPLGVKEGNRIEYLDLLRHGPHGIIVGTTGSGKSEVLVSALLGLALTHHPNQVNFVIVDYKGGTTLGVLADLPHTVGFITDLDGGQTRRALGALDNELKRREEILQRHRMQDIVKYHRNGIKEPLPYLLIVCDEFAELRRHFRNEDMSEIMGKFISMAQRGRALGVWLILAMQDPEGIVDEKIRANLQFKICFRVTEDPKSRDVLGRTDAAYLPKAYPGRGYFQSGKDIFNLFQGVWSNAYVAQPGQEQELDESFVIQQLTPSGTRLTLFDSTSQKARSDLPKSETEALILVRKAVETATQMQIERLPSPWPAPLPDVLPLEKLYKKGQYTLWSGKDWPVRDAEQAGWGLVPLGLLDEPEAQRQPPLVLDLVRQNRSLLIIGMPGAGKTTALLTTLSSLAQTHTPAEAIFHLIDFGSQSLITACGRMPHCAGTYSRDEIEKVHILKMNLREELNKRNKDLLEESVTDLAVFNRRFPERKKPLIVVVINNLTVFRESITANFPEDMPDWIALLRDGGGAGISFAVTSDRIFSGDLFDLFVSRIGLNITDKTNYNIILGKSVDLKEYASQVAGRGFWRSKVPLQMQIALPAGENPERIIEDLQALSDQMDEHWKGPRPMRPGSPGAEFPLKEIAFPDPSFPWEVQPIKGKGLRVPIARDYFNGETVRAHLLADTAYFMITGPSKSGKFNALLALALSLSATYSPRQVNLILVGLKEKALLKLRDLPHCLDVIDSPEQFKDVFDHYKKVMEPRRKDPSRAACEPAILWVIDDYLTFANNVQARDIESLYDITRAGNLIGTGVVALVASNHLSGGPADSLIQRGLKGAGNGLLLKSTDTTATDATALKVRKIPRWIRELQPAAGRGFLNMPDAEEPIYLRIGNLLGDGLGNESELDEWVKIITSRAVFNDEPTISWEWVESVNSLHGE